MKYYIWVGFLILGISGCRVSKKLEISEVKKLTDSRLLNKSLEAEFQYKKLFFKKLQVEYTDDNSSKSFKCNLVNVKDSLIIISIIPLMGIELFRVKMTPSEVVIIDRTQKKVTHHSYAYLSSIMKVDIDYNIIQSIFANHFFVYPSEDEVKEALKKFKHVEKLDHYVMQSFKSNRLERITKKGKQDFIYQEFKIDPNLFRIFEVYIKDFSLNAVLKVKYKDFRNIDNTFIPYKYSISGTSGNKVFNVILNVNDVEINSGGSSSFSISKKYEEIFITQ